MHTTLWDKNIFWSAPLRISSIQNFFLKLGLADWPPERWAYSKPQTEEDIGGEIYMLQEMSLPPRVYMYSTSTCECQYLSNCQHWLCYSYYKCVQLSGLTSSWRATTWSGSTRWRCTPLTPAGRTSCAARASSSSVQANWRGWSPRRTWRRNRSSTASWARPSLSTKCPRDDDDDDVMQHKREK